MHASWRIYLLQAMITGGPLSHLRNFHGFLTNLVRHPPKHEPGGYVRGSSRLKSCRLFSSGPREIVYACDEFGEVSLLQRRSEYQVPLWSIFLKCLFAFSSCEKYYLR